MKKYLAIFTTLFFVGCSTSDEDNVIQINNEPILRIEKQNETQKIEQQMEQLANEIMEDSIEQTSTNVVDGILDLTKLNATMLYAQVYDMVYNIENYRGKKIKIQGFYKEYIIPMQDISRVLMIPDATACCESGMLLKWNENMPEVFPNEDDHIEIIGTYNNYMEDDLIYYYIDVESMNII
ncbi:hypothetical protein AN639_05720 [Candidatus Epulonipiscium fishelsonii]|uniref:Uncharacterized protein n=1 Tax=Candidatus Epulonipiscium fishelsonii TaxID=77094 RepID=A0ACC8XGQ8_9FIRM|nr:hypothetical protein AN639_05720 [Epulopiscium sp. SCG-B05WGA-EpuloA1]ONI42891.1 hypothetical protein AN396_12940 [Epulopiscium sp. SCG-B11WGA-EpuloA1]